MTTFVTKLLSFENLSNTCTLILAIPTYTDSTPTTFETSISNVSLPMIHLFFGANIKYYAEYIILGAMDTGLRLDSLNVH